MNSGFSGKYKYACFIFFHRDKSIILLGVIKKQRALAARDIAHAEKIRKEVLADI